MGSADHDVRLRRRHVVVDIFDAKTRRFLMAPRPTALDKVDKNKKKLEKASEKMFRTSAEAPREVGPPF
jgi:hypothetical protein